MGNTILKLGDQQTYLGVTFDKRMAWKQHIHNAETKAREKRNIMRTLAGMSLKTTYELLHHT